MKTDKFDRREKKRNKRKTYTGRKSGRSVLLLQYILIKRAEKIREEKEDT